MPRALLIAGNSMRFADETDDMERYLRDEVGVTRKRIMVVRTAYVCDGAVEWRLEATTQERTKLPLLITFAGHGGKNGWALDDGRTFHYPTLAKILAKARRPVLVLSDCCHGMAVREFLELARVQPTRVGIICGTEADETYPGGLLRTAMENWRRRKPLRFDERLRWGARLDEGFFPQEPAPATVAETEPAQKPAPDDGPIRPEEIAGGTSPLN